MNKSIKKKDNRMCLNSVLPKKLHAPIDNSRNMLPTLTVI